MRSRLYLRRRTQVALRAFREVSFHPVAEQRTALRNLRSVLPAAPVAVDVGANVGRWAKEFLDLYPRASVILVEAQPELAGTLQRLVDRHESVILRTEVLASEEGTRDFYVCDGDSHHSGSSLLPELTGAPLRPRSVETRTLDRLVGSLDLAGPVDLMKLDTQGSELDILRGATETLRTVSAVQVEVSLVRYNEGGPLVDEVVAFLQARGFFMCDAFDLKYAAGGDDLVQMDCLFSRSVRSISELSERSG